jgi:hypothetical protein
MEQFRVGVGLPWQSQPTQEINADALPYKLQIPADAASIQKDARQAVPEEESNSRGLSTSGQTWNWRSMVTLGDAVGVTEL